jgi:hypothetical protein
MDMPFKNGQIGGIEAVYVAENDGRGGELFTVPRNRRRALWKNAERKTEQRKAGAAASCSSGGGISKRQRT